MSTFQYIRALAEAHNQGDADRFRRTLLQVAARQRTEPQKAELRRLAVDQHTAMQLLPQGTRDMVHAIEPMALGELVLAKPVEAILHDVVDEHRAFGELAARDLRPRNRLLFYGPPGNGKTSAAGAIAGMLGLSGYVVSLPALVDSYMGATSKNLDKLFAVLGAGCVLIIDELDAIGDARNPGHGGAQDRERNLIVSTLLTLLDQAHSGILVATTNRLDMIDPALRRRFEAEVEFPPPGERERAALTMRLSERHGVDDVLRFSDVAKAPSFDAITKAIQNVARRDAVAAAKRSAAAE